ncbi:MAG: hypothetical protein WC560_01625 [Syntrophales bacterium]
MHFSFKGIIVLLCFGFVVLFIQAGVQAQQKEETIEQYVAAAEKTEAEAEAVVAALNQALKAARAAGDTEAVTVLTSAVGQAEVRLQQIQGTVEKVKTAKTVGAARAQARSAEGALGKIQTMVQDLPPRITQTYVAPVLTTTVPPTTVAPTTEETTVPEGPTTTVTPETTIPITTIPTTTTTTSSSTTTTIKPVSPSQ